MHSILFQIYNHKHEDEVQSSLIFLYIKEFKNVRFYNSRLQRLLRCNVASHDRSRILA
nr:MAG TPA: hypothetical protein [Caudoviricetes sp.]